MWCYKPKISALEKLGQEDCEFDDVVGCLGRFLLGKTSNTSS